MSAHTDTGHVPHDDEAPHGSLRGYVTGFVLSIILTAAAFWVVMGHVFHGPVTAVLVISALGVVQIFVHMVYFLHMSTKSENGWSLMALAFALVLVTIVFSGSLWVMYHQNTNMMPMPGGGMAPAKAMPMSPADMRNMP